MKKVMKVTGGIVLVIAAVLLYQKPQKSGTDFYKASAYNSRQTM